MFKTFLNRRRLQQAFQAIENNDAVKLNQLLDQGVSVNAQRIAVLEKYTMSWEETLLSKAIRDERFDLALVLLRRGANPHIGDWVNPHLLQGLVNANTLYRPADLSKPTSVLFDQLPVLRVAAALAYHAQHAPQVEPTFHACRLDESDANPDIFVPRQRFRAHLPEAVKLYQSQLENTNKPSM